MLGTIVTIVRSLLSYVLGGIIMVVCFIPCFTIAALPESFRFNSRIYYWFVEFFYRGIIWSTFVKVIVSGEQNVPDEPSIFVANHQSAFDIPLLGSVVGRHPHIWMFLARYAKVPLFGFIARRMNVVVDHSGLRKLVGSLEEAIGIIKDQPRHVLLFPEGGRYTDDRIHSFFYGFAMLAKETKRPVVPVLLVNVNRVYPPRCFLIHQYPIHILIGEPFFMKIDETEEEFVERVHAWFVTKMKSEITEL